MKNCCLWHNICLKEEKAEVSWRNTDTELCLESCTCTRNVNHFPFHNMLFTRILLQEESRDNSPFYVSSTTEPTLSKMNMCLELSDPFVGVVRRALSLDTQSVQLPKGSTTGKELDTKELETFQSLPVNVYANMGPEYWGTFYMLFVFKAGLLWYYSPIKSQWHQGYTWLLQMLFPNKNTALQLHQTLGPMT